VTDARGSQGTASLQGQTTVTLAAGVASFSGLNYDKAEAMNIAFSSNAGGVSSATSNSIVVSPAAASMLIVSGFSSPVTAGTAGTVTVTAQDAFGNTATGYVGTVKFSSSDPQAVLPGNYTFTATDAGVHTFANGVTLKTAGSQSITATDTVTSSISGSQSGITVNPAAATKLNITAPSSATVSVAFTITVTAQDAYGNTATGYRGTVKFTSSDKKAVLPKNYKFTAADNGVHTFTNGVTLKTTGTQTITATDSGTKSITGTATVHVTKAATAAGLRTEGTPTSNAPRLNLSPAPAVGDFPPFSAAPSTAVPPTVGSSNMQNGAATGTSPAQLVVSGTVNRALLAGGSDPAAQGMMADGGAAANARIDSTEAQDIGFWARYRGDTW
jgi:hypothetical protein